MWFKDTGGQDAYKQLGPNRHIPWIASLKFYDSHALIFACYFRSIMSLLWEAQAESQRLPRIHPEELSNALAHSTVDKGEEERRLPGFATRPSRSGDVNVCSAPGEGRLFSQWNSLEFTESISELSCLWHCLWVKVVFRYYKCYCVEFFFFLVSNLEVSFLINGSIDTADILDEGWYGLLLLFFFFLFEEE